MKTALLIIWLSAAPGTGVQMNWHVDADDCPRLVALLDDPSRRPDWVRAWPSAEVRIACVAEAAE